MTAMIIVGGLIVLISIIFLLLLIVAVASRRFRGAAIGLMLMSLVGGTVFLVFTYLMASRQVQRARVQRSTAEMHQQRLLAEHSLAQQYRQGIVLDDESEADSVADSPAFAEIENPDDMAVEESPAASEEATDEAVGETEAATPEPEASQPDDAASIDTTAPADSTTPADTTAPADTTTPADTTVADTTADGGQPLEDSNPYKVTETFQVERPSWVASPPKMVNGCPAEVIVSDAYVTGDECEENLNQRITNAIQRYASKQSRDSGGPSSVGIRVTPDDVRRVSRDRHLEIVPTSVGPMKQIHQLVVFDNEFERRAKQQVTQAVVGTRLAATGAISGGALILLATSFGLLRIISRSSRDA